MALMEICGTHTASLFRSGVKSLMPANVRLTSGPGCPGRTGGFIHHLTRH